MKGTYSPLTRSSKILNERFKVDREREFDWKFHDWLDNNRERGNDSDFLLGSGNLFRLPWQSINRP